MNQKEILALRGFKSEVLKRKLDNGILNKFEITLHGSVYRLHEIMEFAG